MNLTPITSDTLQTSLNRLFKGYNLSEMAENDDKLERAIIFDDYLIISDLIKNIAPKQE
jgi:hypothetical protein